MIRLKRTPVSCISCFSSVPRIYESREVEGEATLPHRHFSKRETAYAPKNVQPASASRIKKKEEITGKSVEQQTIFSMFSVFRWNLSLDIQL